jgi:RNA polymerase sigma-70 factor (ECF subfamily)
MGPAVELYLLKWKVYFQSRGGLTSREDVFKEIWQRYHRRLFFFIRDMVGEDAEDVIQDIMFKVYQNLERYRPTYSVSTWLYTIARNHCINYLSKCKVKTQNILEKIANSSRHSVNDTPESLAIRKETVEKIDRFMKQLEPAYRQMAFLRFYEGLKFGEIAQIMDVPVGTVKSRIHLIRKDLKKSLEACDAF